MTGQTACDNSVAQAKLSNFEMLSVASGRSTRGALESLFLVVFPVIIRDVLGGSHVTVNVLCSSLHSVFACTIHPLVGSLSDHIRSPLGKRVPLILASIPFLLVTMVLLSMVTTFHVFVILLMIFMLAMNVFETCHGALLPDMIPTAQRGTASGMLESLSALGGIIIIFGGAVLYHRHRSSWVWIGSGFVIVPSLLIFHVAGRFKKRGWFEAFDRNTETARRAGRKRTVVMAYLRSIFADPQVTPLFLVIMCLGVYFAALGPNLVNYTKEIAGVPKDWAMGMQMLPRLVTLLVAIPMGLFGDRIGKVKALVLSFAISLMGCMLGFLTRDPWLMGLVLLVLGLGGAGKLVMLNAYFADKLPPAAVGRLVGVTVLFLGFARAAMGAVMGSIIESFGFGSIWIVAALANLAAIAILMGYTKAFEKSASPAS